MGCQHPRLTHPGSPPSKFGPEIKGAYIAVIEVQIKDLLKARIQCGDMGTKLDPRTRLIGQQFVELLYEFYAASNVGRSKALF